MTAFVANTNILELRGLKSNVEGGFINDAAVEVTVKDSTNTPLVAEGVEWPVEMEYVEGSQGDYRATLVHTLPFQHGKQYKAFCDADAGPNRIGHWELSFKPETRASKDEEE